MGACVINLATGETVFAENPEMPLTPASSMKLFVMAAALSELGPDFAFETIFAIDGTNIVVIGDGDPATGDEKLHHRRGESITADFERWATILLEIGVKAIPGDLLIDESIFDDQWVHPSWEEDDLDNWYAAPVGGLNFNDNCIDITVFPAKRRDAPVLVTFQPETALVRIINKCRTGGEGTPVVHHPPGSFEYIIRGRCSKRWPFGSVSFPDPGLLFADSLRTVLANRGVKVAGTIQRKRVRLPNGGLPPSLSVLARRTTPLSDLLRRVGKDSQNLFAECLLKRTGFAWAQRRGDLDPQGSWSLGKEAVLAFMRQSGIDARGLVLADGSGLSRENACTARQLASLLAWTHKEGKGRLLYEGLSVAGVDGSLRKRLKDIPGRVRAKTGTMRGVRTLAGYVDAEAGPRYAFAVLFNGYKGPSTPYKQIQDRICRVLAGAVAPGPGSE
ncbi:MAG: D-alanyl-D-alanine carboxypeptidase/D-alanyl-D-alanine-endopeptidase [Phycisphaerales bacterium]|nr:MAG: D-alanyl-D-alanine carboxypeptidase/D-alanyl-D-alanine-endopeptidase [Phycisphaerales bacterium]